MADNIGILCKKKNVGDSGILLCPFSSLRLYISFCFAESEIAFLSRLQIAILVSWVEFHVFWKCCWFRSNLNLTRYQKLGQKWTQKKYLQFTLKTHFNRFHNFVGKEILLNHNHCHILTILRWRKTTTYFLFASLYDM